MGTVYCEFCGAPANTRVVDAAKLVRWIKDHKDVVRCDRHGRTSKLAPASRRYNPFTGEHRGDRVGQFQLSEDEWPEA